MVKKILSKKQINDLAKSVVREAKKDKINISQVIVFGSYAKKKATEKSDLDLCFISKDFKNIFKAETYLRVKIHELLKENHVFDVVAYSPKDFKLSIPLIFEIKATGTRIL